MDSALSPFMDGLNWADMVILGVLLFSTLVSIVRGLLRELISLMTWVLAIVLSATCSRALADYLSTMIATPSLRLVVSLAILFVSALLIGAIINIVMRSLVKRSGMTGVDRFFGIAFGAARGFLVVSVMVMLGRLVGVNQDPWWQESIMIHYFLPTADFLQRLVPEQIHQLSGYLQWQDSGQLQQNVQQLPEGGQQLITPPPSATQAPAATPPADSSSAGASTFEALKDSIFSKFSHIHHAPQVESAS